MADRVLFLSVMILMGIGLVFSYSLPVYIETKYGWSEFHFFLRYFGFGLIGLILIYLFSQCNPDKCIAKIGFFLLIVGGITIILMPTPILAPLCPAVKGARRWVKLFGLSIAPVEFFKIGIIFFFAWSFSRKLIDRDFRTLKEEIFAILPYIAVFGIIGIYIVIFQSDLGEVLLLVGIFAFMLMFTKVTTKVFGFLSIGVIIMALFAIIQKPYRLERVKSFLYNIYLLFPPSWQNKFDIQVSSLDISYQIRQSINAIHNGGLSGVGIGAGQIKMGFLSDVHTDFVLAGIAEET